MLKHYYHERDITGHWAGRRIKIKHHVNTTSTPSTPLSESRIKAGEWRPSGPGSSWAHPPNHGRTKTSLKSSLFLVIMKSIELNFSALRTPLATLCHHSSATFIISGFNTEYSVLSESLLFLLRTDDYVIRAGTSYPSRPSLLFAACMVVAFSLD